MKYVFALALAGLLLAPTAGRAAAPAPTAAASPVAAPAPSAALSTPAPTSPATLPAAASAQYRISPGDTLAIVVWGQSQLSQTCQVNAVGTISYALLGDVPAAGATCEELQARLTQGLEKYVKKPVVLVSVSSYGAAGMSVFVLGEVNKPGIYPLASGSGGLMQVLAEAGGPTAQASGQITITRAGSGKSYVTGLEQAVAAGGDPRAQPQPGDVVYVQRDANADVPRQYTVLGEVPSPGVFDMPQGEVRVLDAMKNAGLLSGSAAGAGLGTRADLQARMPTADLAHALLTRGNVAVPLDLLALLSGDTSQNVLLQPGDVLTVPRRAVITVSVMGEVHSPGQHVLPVGASLLDLLTAVGGANADAHLSAAALLRESGGKMGRVRVNLADALRGGDGNKTQLKDGDILIVPAQGNRMSLWQWVTLVPYIRMF